MRDLNRDFINRRVLEAAICVNQRKL